MATWVVGFYSSDVGHIDECTCNITLKEERDNNLVITASGYFEIEVEAGTREEARYKAIIILLKKRVEDLVKMNSNHYTQFKTLEESFKEVTKKMSDTDINFSKIIRLGELHLCNTGNRILGSWFKDPKVIIELPHNAKLGAIIKALEEAVPYEEDCY